MSSEPFGRVRRFLRELKRRNVYKVAVAYVAVAFVVLQGARLLVPALVLPEWFYRVVVALALLGFPLALVVAWAFEMTAEGVRRTPEAEPEEGEAAQARAGLQTGYKVLVGLGLVGAAVAGGWYLTGGGGEAEVSDRTVAVLPFETLGDSAAGSLTDGVHNALITRLQQISDLTIIARPSVMRYEGSDKPLSMVAEELGARWIVTGAVQAADNQILVNPRLVNPRNGTERWSESYRRSLTAEDLFTLQSEITKQIAQSLEAELSPDERKRVNRQPTENLDAYQLYVRGRRELARREKGDVKEAVRLFRRAIEQDSSFARAWSGLADAAGPAWFGGAYEGYDTLGITALGAAQRAVELAPGLAETHASMGLAHYRQRNGPASLQELRRALELKPSYAEAHTWLGRTYLVLGRPDRALKHLEVAEELNPEHLYARHFLYDTYIMKGRIKEALAEIRNQRQRYPGYRGTFVAESRALYHLGRYEEAHRVFRQGRSKAKRDATADGSDRAWRHAYLAVIETAMGDTARAQDRLATLQAEDAPPLPRAFVHAAFENTDAVFSTLEDIKDWSYVPTFWLRYLTFPRGMSEIREDPRYDELIRQVNQYWSLNPDGSLPDSVDVSFEALR